MNIYAPSLYIYCLWTPDWQRGHRLQVHLWHFPMTIVNIIPCWPLQTMQILLGDLSGYLPSFSFLNETQVQDSQQYLTNVRQISDNMGPCILMIQYEAPKKNNGWASDVFAFDALWPCVSCHLWIMSISTFSESEELSHNFCLSCVTGLTSWVLREPQSTTRQRCQCQCLSCLSPTIPTLLSKISRQ